MVHASDDEDVEPDPPSTPACRCRLPGCPICSERDFRWRPGLSREEAQRRSKLNREMTVRQNRKKAERTAQAEASGGREPAERQQARLAEGDSKVEGAPPPVAAAKQRRHRSDGASASPAGAASATPVTEDGSATDAPPPPLYEKLPTELWQRILSSLDPHTACNAACCDKQLNTLISDPSFWLALQQSIFGSAPQQSILGQAPAAGAVGLLSLWDEEEEAGRAGGAARQRERESIPGSSASHTPKIEHAAGPHCGSSGARESIHGSSARHAPEIDERESILGASARRRCCASDAALHPWRRACTPGVSAAGGFGVGAAGGLGVSPSGGLGVGAAGRPLAGLSGMVGCCFTGDLGVSVHTDNFTRLWEANSGRRLGAFQHKGKANLTCVAAGEGESYGHMALVGNSDGQVSYFGLEDETGFHASPCGIISDVGRPIEQLLLLTDTVPAMPRGVAVDRCGEVFFFTPGEMMIVERLCCNAQAVASGGLGSMFLTGHGSHGVPLALGPGYGWGETNNLAAKEADAIKVDLNASVVVWTGYSRSPPAPISEGPSLVAAAAGGIFAAQPPALPNISILSLFDEGESASARIRPLGSYGPRSACFSPGWQLLAAVDAGRVILWDVRAKGSAPVGVVRLPGAQRAASVSLDPGGEGWAGHMLVGAERHSAVHVFDIRRLQSAANDGKENSNGGRQYRGGAAHLGHIGTGGALPACVATSHRRLCIGAASRSAAALLFAPVGRSPENGAGEATAGKAAAAPTAGKKKARVQKEHSRKSRPQ